jgi:hypothetical protein
VRADDDDFVGVFVAADLDIEIGAVDAHNRVALAADLVSEPGELAAEVGLRIGEQARVEDVALADVAGEFIDVASQFDGQR